ncbi:MAG: Eco57I restriction-modification methylase domain-containing protein, partial [Bacteroidaceae bacterium]|nr:Eco57I restriction-modification methylase domain-containing protein [Bacteroidaceae bacterium]
ENNILVVCKTPMARSITKRTLAGFRDTTVNARYYKNLIENISETPAVVINTFRDGKRFWNIKGVEYMKFDAIVGNPPYQVMDGGTDRGAVPVYQHFVNIAKQVKPSYISLIMPARWYAGGRGLEDFRVAMLQDKSMQVLYDFETSKDIFPTVDIAGGICYFLWNKENTHPCTVCNANAISRVYAKRYLNDFDVFVRSNRSISILKKVTSKSTGFLNSMVLSINPFGFRTYFRGRAKHQQGDIRILTSEGWSYVAPAEITKGNEYVGKYKIIVGRFVPSNGELNVKPGEGYRVLTMPKILNPYEINTETYIDTAVFDTEEEAENYKRYLCTKFARFILRQAITSVNVTRECFTFVPIQDFTHQWTDRELYDKYGLSEEECQYIEALIKPLE